MRQALTNPLIFLAVGVCYFFGLLYNFIVISKPTGIQDCVLWVMGSFKVLFLYIQFTEILGGRSWWIGR